MTPARRAVVVSESELLRAGLVALGSAAELEIAGELDSAAHVDDTVRSTRADVVLAAPVRIGSERFYASLRRLPNGCRALVMLGVPGFRIRAAVLRRRYGLGSLPLDADAAALGAALRALFGDSEERTLAVEAVCAGPGGVLSVREQEVLHELAHGFGNRAIAERLVVSQDTVKTHLRSVYRKLGVSTRAEAVALYVGELGSD
jgi:DNA-binding NarL/FixJ family response regulator